MSMRAKISAAVDTAFDAIGDLKQTGTLTTKVVSDYDFATQSTVSSTSTETVTLFLDTTRSASGDGFNISATIKGSIDLEVYDTLTVGGSIYNILSYSDNGFVTEAMLKRGR